MWPLITMPLAGEYVERRGSSVRNAVRKAGRCGKAALPLAVVESSSKCNTDSNGVKTLPDGTCWVASLLEQVSCGLSCLATTFPCLS